MTGVTTTLTPLGWAGFSVLLKKYLQLGFSGVVVTFSLGFWLGYTALGVLDVSQ